jgi:phosphoketolase
MSANPHANGGLLRRDLVMPNFAECGEPRPRQ